MGPHYSDLQSICSRVSERKKGRERGKGREKIARKSKLRSGGFFGSGSSQSELEILLEVARNFAKAGYGASQKFSRALAESPNRPEILPGSSYHIAPLKVLQNKVCRTILSMNSRTSEVEIDPKMNQMKKKNPYKFRLFLFVSKNKDYFHIYDSVSYSRTGGASVAVYPKRKKYHSRL